MASDVTLSHRVKRLCQCTESFDRFLLSKICTQIGNLDRLKTLTRSFTMYSLIFLPKSHHPLCDNNQSTFWFPRGCTCTHLCFEDIKKWLHELWQRLCFQLPPRNAQSNCVSFLTFIPTRFFRGEILIAFTSYWICSLCEERGSREHVWLRRRIRYVCIWQLRPCAPDKMSFVLNFEISNYGRTWEWRRGFSCLLGGVCSRRWMG